MLRQHHVKIQDLVNYLRGYDPVKPQTAEDWSKHESSGFEPGMLLFCLERVSAPSGLAFGKKDSEGETYRVKDLCVVVGRDSNRSLVVNITASAFELRYLEVLMLEKARKAILDGKDFLYVAVKPAQPLAESKLREIEELGAMYAQGGSRRSLVVDASGPQEPAVALLAALGVKLSIGGIGKQVLDIGSICHMLFAPEGRQEDKNKSLVKTCFTAIPNNEPIGKGGQTSPVTASAVAPQRVRPAPPPAQPTQDWSASPSNSGWAQDLPPVEEAPQASTFGYDQPIASAPPAQGFGYETPLGAQAPGFGYDQVQVLGEPTPWHQPAPGATTGFAKDLSGLSGLNPFAPPEEVEHSEQSDLTPPDFASQFKDDLDKGLAGEGAIKFEESQMAQDSDRWAVEGPREFSQDDYSQKFAPPPDLIYGQPSPAQQYAVDQFPPSTVFTEQQFNNEHFQAPDFGQPTDLSGAPQAMTDLTGPPQEVFQSFPPIASSTPAPSEDLFQPPYENSMQSEDPQLPPELTAQLDPQNQLFQAADVTSGNEIEATQGESGAVAPIPEVNFGFDAFNQQPPSEFVDSVFDTTRGAFEKTSRAMSFEEEGEQEASPNKTPAPSVASASPASAGQEPPAWAPAPADDWTPDSPTDADWGVDAVSTGDTVPWTPEPGAPAQSPQQQTPVIDEVAAAPAWNFEAASQAPAWNPEPAPEVSSSPSWIPVPNTPKTANPLGSTGSGAGASDAEPSSSTPSLFERLNQQLQKGSLSEIEPPPEAPVMPKPESEQGTTSEAQETAEKLGETTLALNADSLKEPKSASDPDSPLAPDVVPISETPLPPPPVAEGPLKTPQPLPLGVSRKNAPLILDWPSANADEPSSKKPDPVTDLPAATPATSPATSPVTSSAKSPATSSATSTPATTPAASTAAAPSATPVAAANPEVVTGAGDGIKHLAEALSGLMGEDSEPRMMSPFAKITSPVTDVPAPSVPPIAEAQTEQVDVVVDQPALVGEQTEAALTAQTTEPQVVKAETVPDPALAAVEAAPEEEFEEEEELSPSAILAAKGFQEPRLVMNEMASLMSKLEQQVQKAAKRLNARAEEIKQRLLTQVDGLVAECALIEKESQRSTTNLSQRLSKQLDDVCEESRLKVSDVAANGRYTIKQLLTANQHHVDENKNTLYESLREACKQFRIETEALARTAETDLNELVNSRTEELNKVVQAMSTHLDDTNSGFNLKLKTRFERFKERMSEEASSVVRSLERNVRSMSEEIDGSWDRASEKLKSSKSDFEQTIQHSVKTAELNLSQSTRLMLTNALIPKLRERQQVLRMTSVELSKRFSEESEGQVSGQILGLEASLAAARQQLQTLVDDCMSSIDSVGRGQQAGLEEIFKETSLHAEHATTEVTEFLNKIESQINENELTCKRLAETSSIDNDPELSNERNSATARVQQLRQQANAELGSAIDQGCDKIELLSNRIQAEVSAQRVEHTQAVRDSAENGLTRVRDAIQEAFSAIQAAREKYME
jgi:hypothetical protein